MSPSYPPAPPTSPVSAIDVVAAALANGIHGPRTSSTTIIDLLNIKEQDFTRPKTQRDTNTKTTTLNTDQRRNLRAAASFSRLNPKAKPFCPGPVVASSTEATPRTRALNPEAKMFSSGIVPVMFESKEVCSKSPETCCKSSDVEQCNAARLEAKQEQKK